MAKIQCHIRAARIGKVDGFVYNTEREKIEAVIELLRKKNLNSQWKIFGLHFLRINGETHVAVSVDTGVDRIFHRFYMVFIGKERIGSCSDDLYIYFDFYFRGPKDIFFESAHLFDEVTYLTQWRKMRTRNTQNL